MEAIQQRTRPGFWLFLLSAFILIFAYIRWEDVVIQHPDGSYAIDDATRDKVADRVERIEHKAEFYALVAKSNGYYACPLCPPEAMSNGKFFLKYTETYKVGVTINPNNRYSKAELAKWNLIYVVLAVGNYAEMLVLETNFMGSYALHPENLGRPKHRRLITPPGSGTNLR